MSHNPYSNSPILRSLARRVLDIAHRHHLSHLGSCLTALPIIYSVYESKRPDDRVILSAGHSGLALYVVLEFFGLIPSAEERLWTDGIHPTRGPGVDVSTGSLGQGITVGVGMALVNPDRDVHVISTDGEMAEGAWWECLFFVDQYKWGHRDLSDNLHIHVNDNGWTALRSSWIGWRILEGFSWVNQIDTRDYVPTDLLWFQGLGQHYHVMTDEQYTELLARYAD